MNKTGKVYLVGAGPGDTGLLTLKGKALLMQAESVVYDRLVSQSLLDIACSARMIDVGKKQGEHPVPQDEINSILVREAKEGRMVVRLKGGDPYIFGRGGEEVEALVQNGIGFEVVPGVTSAVAALSYGGIPATHRDAASSVHIITAHAKAGSCLNINYSALCELNGTLIFLMGVSSMHEIARGLMDAGMPETMPAAVVENGTLPRQRKLVSTLGSIADQVRQVNIKSPAILTVGKVCAYSNEMDWFSRLPLKGKTVIVTRPLGRSGTLSDKLRALGADVVCFPCISTENICGNAVTNALNNLKSYSWLVLTSPQGVSAMYAAMKKLAMDSRALSGLKIAAVGKATAKELELYGICADLVPEKYDGRALGESLVKLLSDKDRVLILRAKKPGPGLSGVLDRAGAEYSDIAVYETSYKSEKSGAVKSLAASESPIYVTFTSASTAEAFNACTGGIIGSGLVAVCIGEQTEKRARQLGYKTVTAERAEIDSMISKILEEEA